MRGDTSAGEYHGHRAPLSWLCLAIVLLGAPGCRAGADSYSPKILGGVEVKGGEASGALPRRAPQTIYVADFALDAEKYGGDEGLRGALPGRLGQRGPRLLAKDNPVERARQFVETVAESVVEGLTTRGLAALRFRDPAGQLPPEGWLVQGVFTEVDEGNRMKRALIGFGKGATSMDLQIWISDLGGQDPRAPFAVFGTVKDPSKIPGAVVTLNPYVAATRFVLQKNATERDVQATAKQIVEEVVKYRRQIAEGAEPGAR
jgi:hypothetical protein